jgi:glycerol-3-phosphate dehydrogenase
MIYYDNKEFDSEIKYRVYLLNKYLTIHYDKNTATALIKQHSNDLNKLARILGKIDIGFFCLYFLSDIFVVKDNNESRNLSQHIMNYGI